MARLRPKAIVLWGGTGQAKVVREAVEPLGYDIAAVVDNDPSCTPPFPDIPLLHGWRGLREWLEQRANPDYLAVVAIGGERGLARLELQRALTAHGIPPLTVIHSTAFVASNAKLGAGCQILAQAAVCAEVELGEACIINTGASVDHECRLADGVHVAAGARLAGLVNVGAGATLYTGAVVLPRINIGQGAVVGAGSVVTRDVEAYAVVAGNPARFVRSALEKNDE